jgi:hypothetical protein
VFAPPEHFTREGYLRHLLAAALPKRYGIRARAEGNEFVVEGRRPGGCRWKISISCGKICAEVATGIRDLRGSAKNVGQGSRSRITIGETAVARRFGRSLTGCSSSWK